MDKKMNTIIDFEFCDGTTAKMTLTFYALYQLKAKNKALYERYNKIMSKNISEELEMITVMYTAYACANLSEENLMTEEEFMIKCGSDRIAIRDAVQELTQPKKH
jgi:hypothetical protein